MKAKITFPGGVHPDCSKNSTKDLSSKKVAAGDVIVLPLLQHIGNPAKPIVKIGDLVKKGQLVAEQEGFISSNIYSSVSGKVTAIKAYSHPVLGSSQAIVIENDHKGEMAELLGIKNFEELTGEDIVLRIKQAGIVGLGGAAFPSYVKAMVKEENKLDTLIINAVECEPFLTCDYRVMLEKTKELIQGIEILNQAIKADKIYLAIEDNKPVAIQKIRGFLYDKGISSMEVKVLKTKYPQGGEKQIIKAILNREVPPGKLPLEVGCVVQNVGTCLAIYEAIVEGKPLIERMITITGQCVKRPGNYKVAIGTLVKDIIETVCQGFTEEPAKIISGGPMMGMAQYTIDTPVIKGTSGIVCLTDKEVSAAKESACLNCGKCVEVCPMNLLPTRIARAVKHNKVQELENFYITDCMECGSCTYKCPAHIPLVQYVKIGKQQLRKLKQAK